MGGVHLLTYFSISKQITFALHQGTILFILQKERLKSDVIVCIASAVLVFAVSVSTAFSSPILQVPFNRFYPTVQFVISFSWFLGCRIELQYSPACRRSDGKLGAAYWGCAISDQSLRSRNYLALHRRWPGPTGTLKCHDHHHQQYSILTTLKR